MLKRLLPLLLALSIGGCQQSAFAQASPYNLFIFKAQSFTDTGQTGATIQLNGLTPGNSTVGSSYASGTITVTATALTTASFQVMGSSDNGVTFYLLPVYSVASPITPPVTTVIATAAGLYQISLAGLSHIKFVTSGTFTATSVSLTLTASPNASVARNNGGGGGASLTANQTFTGLNHFKNAQGIFVDAPSGTDSAELAWVSNSFFMGASDGTHSITYALNPVTGFESASGSDLLGQTPEVVAKQTANIVGTGVFNSYANLETNSADFLSPDNTFEYQIGLSENAGPVNMFAAVGDVTTTIQNTNIKLIGNVTINGAAPGGGATATLEHSYSSSGSFTFAHNLGSLFYVSRCFVYSGGTYSPASWTDFPVDTNNATVAVGSAGDYICSFNASGAFTPPAPDFSVAVSPGSQTFWPTMTGTQTTPAYTITQTVIGGYTGTAAYTATGLAGGMSAAFAPSSITSGGTSALTLSFPSTQAAATTSFTATGNDGTNTHSANPSITIGNINAGMIECWPMTDGSGSTFADGCGTSNTETVQAGSLTWGAHTGLPGTTPLFGSGVYTTGANQTATNFNGTTPFSVSSWVAAGSASAAFISTLDPSNNYAGWELLYSLSGSSWSPIFSLVNNFGGGNLIQVTAVTPLVFADARYLVVTYDGSRTAAGVKMYVNGSPISLTTTTDALTASAVNSKPVAFGGRVDGTQTTNGGIISYTRIYNRVLSSSDISTYFGLGAR